MSFVCVLFFIIQFPQSSLRTIARRCYSLWWEIACLSACTPFSTLILILSSTYSHRTPISVYRPPFLKKRSVQQPFTCENASKFITSTLILCVLLLCILIYCVCARIGNKHFTRVRWILNAGNFFSFEFELKRESTWIVDKMQRTFGGFFSILFISSILTFR